MDKKQKALVDIINYMFIISNHNITYDDIIDRKDNWYQQYTMTSQQCQQWKNWGIDYLNKNLKINKKLAKKEMEWLNLEFGLKISD